MPTRKRLQLHLLLWWFISQPSFCIQSKVLGQLVRIGGGILVIRWISDRFQMDLRWITDGSQMDLIWISYGSQMDVHLVILTTYYYPIGCFVYLLYFLYWNQPTSASSGSYAILFLLFLFLLLLLPPLKIRLSETFRMPKFLHHFCSP